MEAMQHIRNFCIIAHIDHGKSTLADRLIEITGGLSTREMASQVLDTLDLERERGITIKMQTVCLQYRSVQGPTYTLHLIDTPGHVDFSYEVSRSLAACEGALLVVDAAQGVEAQTLANVYLALEQGLEIIPVLNKIDLPSAEPQRIEREIAQIVGLPTEDLAAISAKQGLGIEKVLEQVVSRVPPPSGDRQEALRALIFDAWFDNYLGVVVMIRVMSGAVRTGERIRFMASGQEFEVSALGKFYPKRREEKTLQAGEVGFLAAGIKRIQDAQVGDTLTSSRRPAKKPLPGYSPVRPMVFAGLYPAEGEQFTHLKEALEKLALNDAALSFEPESSAALGFGFRCKFLGRLHLEIVQQRLEREMRIALITTAPSVVYEVHLQRGEKIYIENPARLPDPQQIAYLAEPFILARIMVPARFVGGVMALAQERRGTLQRIEYLDEQSSRIEADSAADPSRASEAASAETNPEPAQRTARAMLSYEIPLGEVILDFHDQLKSATRGYGSLDYEPIGFRRGDLVKMDILLNGELVDALSAIVPREKAYLRGRELAQRLREHIPRQMFEVAIQAALGSRIIARETVKALRKNVTAKCYGGDVSRKRKLLQKQKEGKKRMKHVGSVEVPQEAFMAVLELGDDR